MFIPTLRTPSPSFLQNYPTHPSSALLFHLFNTPERPPLNLFFFFFNYPAPPEISPFSLPAALPISELQREPSLRASRKGEGEGLEVEPVGVERIAPARDPPRQRWCGGHRLGGGRPGRLVDREIGRAHV